MWNLQQRDISKYKYYNYNQFKHITKYYPKPKKPQNPNHSKPQTFRVTNNLEAQLVQQT